MKFEEYKPKKNTFDLKVHQFSSKGECLFKDKLDLRIEEVYYKKKEDILAYFIPLLLRERINTPVFNVVLPTMI